MLWSAGINWVITDWIDQADYIALVKRKHSQRKLSLILSSKLFQGLRTF